MGTWHDAATVQAMIDHVPDGSLLVLDEAYIEFAPAGLAPSIDIGDPRVIRFRTFSKAYGMAGARIGYGIAEKNLASAFNKERNHFGVNRMAQAGALAALADHAWLAGVQQSVVVARGRISAIARANGLIPLASASNFVTVDCGRDQPYARAVLDGLIARDVFVRMPFVAPQNRCIRISAGTAADLDILEEALPAVLASLA
jgi:histidinol-phosphate aminotransferase